MPSRRPSPPSLVDSGTDTDDPNRGQTTRRASRPRPAPRTSLPRSRSRAPSEIEISEIRRSSYSAPSRSRSRRRRGSAVNGDGYEAAPGINIYNQDENGNYHRQGGGGSRRNRRVYPSSRNGGDDEKPRRYAFYTPPGMRRSGGEKTAPVYVTTSTTAAASKTDDEKDQDSDDVLDDYYGGGGNGGVGADADIEVIEVEYDDPLLSGGGYGRPRPSGRMYSASSSGGRPDAQPVYQDYDEARVRRSKESRPLAAAAVAGAALPSRVQEIQCTAVRDDYMRSPPAGAARKGLWPRAAVVAAGGDEGRFSSSGGGGGGPRDPYDRYDSRAPPLTLPLKLVLTRRGERFKGREFLYTRGSWDDAAFARHLQREYRSLKARQIGLLQKLTSYRVVAFVYFLQYHAYPARKFPYGHWRISDRKSVTRRCDQAARNAFMWKLQRLGKRGGGGGRKGAGREWTCRLDSLVELGAVVDIEVKEQFDTVKIYIGLLAAVLSSLAVGLAYGFATDRDFATGFSISSWMITAFGFVIAAIAAGEYIGLEKPAASLNTGVELSTGTYLDRELLN